MYLQNLYYARINGVETNYDFLKTAKHVTNKYWINGVLICIQNVYIYSKFTYNFCPRPQQKSWNDKNLSTLTRSLVLMENSPAFPLYPFISNLYLLVSFPTEKLEYTAYNFSPLNLSMSTRSSCGCTDEIVCNRSFPVN